MHTAPHAGTPGGQGIQPAACALFIAPFLDFVDFRLHKILHQADYARLQAIGIPLPELIACDRAQERILKEFIDGETVYSLLLQDALPETCLDQVRAMCAILYPANTNIDYFPTNFVLQDGRLYYIDYECNDYMEQWDFEHWGIKYWSRTPEFLQYAKETST